MSEFKMSHLAREQRNGTRYGLSPLGPTQSAVLAVLGHHGALSARQMAIQDASLTESGARSAISTLADRGLVVRARGFDDRRHTFELTSNGRRAASTDSGRSGRDN